MQFRQLRWPCRHPLTVERAGRHSRASLGNIAAGGALVVGLDGVGVGETLILHLPGGRRTAEVRWAAAARCGIRFAAPLQKAELDLIRGRPGRGARHLHLRARELG